MRCRSLFRAGMLASIPLAACGSPPEPAVAKAPVVSEEGHHHELHLPPVGTNVRVTLDGKGVDVPLATLPHEGTTLPLVQLWKAAWPNEDGAPLHFDLTGSDGFHPASRPPCARLLRSVEINAARIDVVSHDVSFDDTVQLPGCYRVKAVVSMDATH